MESRPSHLQGALHSSFLIPIWLPLVRSRFHSLTHLPILKFRGKVETFPLIFRNGRMTRRTPRNFRNGYTYIVSQTAVSYVFVLSYFSETAKVEYLTTIVHIENFSGITLTGSIHRYDLSHFSSNTEHQSVFKPNTDIGNFPAFT